MVRKSLMYKLITIEKFLYQLGDGQSKPIAIIGNDGKHYVIKTTNIFNEKKKTLENWNAVMIQELLVFNIARYLGIRTPSVAIANLDSTTLPTDFKENYKDGLYFASEFIHDAENNYATGSSLKQSWTDFLKGIDNSEDVPKIIVLDLLTANFDRFGNNGNIVVTRNKGKRWIQIIDHGDCFWGYTWEHPSKQQMMQMAGNNETYMSIFFRKLMASSGSRYPMSGLGEIFRAFDQYIDVSDVSNHCFKSIVQKAATITPEIIDDWLSEIPQEWYSNVIVQRKLYKSFFHQQQKILPVLISNMAKFGAFQSWLGQDLKWNKGCEA
jgi:hypothetical protein